MRDRLPIWLQAYQEKQKSCSEQRILELIEKNGGYLQAIVLKGKGKQEICNRLFAKEKLFRVHLSQSKGSGAYKRGKSIFYEEYREKTFYCDSRSSLVRLIMKALIEPKSAGEKHILGSFLARVVSPAERVAICWKLGYDLENKNIDSLRSFLKKQSISLDGFYQAKRTSVEMGKLNEAPKKVEAPSK